VCAGDCGMVMLSRRGIDGCSDEGDDSLMVMAMGLQ
jgi:hypothetical protein